MPRNQPSSQEFLRKLYTADLPIIVVNPLSTPLSSLYPSSTHSSSPSSTTLSSDTTTHFPYPLPSHSLIVLTTAPPISTSASRPVSPQSLPPSLQQTLSSLLPPTSHSPLHKPNSISTTLGSRILLIDSPRALHALRAFRAAPSSPYAVDRYQDDTLASGISALGRAINIHLQQSGSQTSSGSDVLDSVQALKTRALLVSALSMMERELGSAKDELYVATDVVRTLRDAVGEARLEVEMGIFGGAAFEREGSPGAGGSLGESSVIVRNEAHMKGMKEGEDKIEAAMKRAEAAVKPVVDGLSWWRTLWRADEVGWMVRGAIRAAWASEVERSVSTKHCPYLSYASSSMSLTQ